MQGFDNAFGDVGDTFAPGGFFERIEIHGSCAPHPTRDSGLESTNGAIVPRILLGLDVIETFKQGNETFRCYFTSVSFKDVRCIRFSRPSGDENLSIPGLLLDYGNGDSAVIGQWRGELGSIDIDEGDSIVHIRIWFSQDRSIEWPNGVHHNRGKMVGMKIRTANGAFHEQLVHTPWDGFAVDYYANRLQQFVRGLPLTPSGRLQANLALARPCLGLQPTLGPRTGLVAPPSHRTNTITYAQRGVWLRERF